MCIVCPTHHGKGTVDSKFVSLPLCSKRWILHWHPLEPHRTTSWELHLTTPKWSKGSSSIRSLQLRERAVTSPPGPFLSGTKPTWLNWDEARKCLFMEVTLMRTLNFGLVGRALTAVDIGTPWPGRQYYMSSFSSLQYCRVECRYLSTLTFLHCA